jgi:plastocyanin
MKHLITLAAFALGLSAQATVHIVTCQNGPYHFLPVTVYAEVGDTVHWTWVSGTHIVGVVNETDIPEAADSWYGLVTQAYPTYDYVITVPGDYHYVCHPQSPHGEDGYFVVSTSTAVQEAAVPTGTLFYPNPFAEQLTVESSGANGLVLYNALGDRVASYALTGRRTQLRTDEGTLPKGVYFCELLRNGVVVGTRRLVRQ